MPNFSDRDLIHAGLRVLEIEAASISNLSSKLDANFVAACQAILACSGRVIVVGIGKSGHIARKIAATFASTGTPAFFVHPAEAAHGDIGMFTSNDLMIAISKSGETQEILSFMPVIKRRGIKVIAMLGKLDSTIATMADINLDVSVTQEACALNLAPTASTTATLAMGDALAISILQARGFTEEDFAMSHPGGVLGRRLLIKISDIMFSGADLPKVFSNTLLPAAIIEMSQKRLGMTTVVAAHDPHTIIGICTDGDLRRAFGRNIDVQKTSIQDIMTTNFKTIYADLLATEAVHLMQSHKISALPVVDRNNKLVGALNIHNIFASGVV
jgi:arabinose-5-phosphate isomerase